MTLHGGPTVKSKRQSWILDYTLWILDSRYWVAESLSVKLGSGFQSLAGFPDPLSCILDSKAQDSGLEKETFSGSLFHKKKFPASRNPDSDTWDEIHNSPVLWIPGSGFLAAVKLRFRIPWAGLRIPKPRIPDFASRNFPDSEVYMQRFLRVSKRL